MVDPAPAPAPSPTPAPSPAPAPAPAPDPAPKPAPAAPAPAAPSNVADTANAAPVDDKAGDWPADWRERMAIGADGKADAKQLERLKRYESPIAFNKAFFEAD